MTSRPVAAPPLPHSDIHPAALPPEHTVVFLTRLLPDTPREAFALWQMTAEDFRPMLGVLLDGQLEGGRGQSPACPSKPRRLWVLSKSPSRPG